MPRAKAILQSEYPYHVCARCINQEWFQISMERTWEIFSEELYWVNKTHNFQIVSFVLMSNHFHLILKTPESNISDGMQQFMKNSSRRLTQAGNRINQTFAGRHYKTVVSDPCYFLNVYKYNYFNPVSAGLVRRVEDYKFSTLRGLLGIERLLVPLVFDRELIENTEVHLDWLNERPTTEKWKAIKVGLSKSVFTPPKSRLDGRPLLREGEVV